MISFAPTPEQDSAREAMRAFAASAMRGRARECDEASAIPDAFLTEAWQLGLHATQLPDAYGGYGAARSPVTNALVLEELAYGDPALAIAAMAPSPFVYAVAEHGTEAQRQAYLPPFAGERVTTAALALVEPVPLFDPYAPHTAVTRTDGRFQLSGTKCLVPLADRATHFLVVARDGDRLEAFIVGRAAAGVSIATPERNLGLKALPTGTVTFDAVSLTEADRLGGAAGADIPRLIAQCRTALAAVLNGVARAVLDYCIPYAKERVAFGEPIARKQAIAFRLAEMHMEVESMRWMIWKAAGDLEHGRDATRSAQLARLYAAEKAMWIADNGVQVLGGHGFIREHPVELWYRSVRTASVLEGTVAV